MQQIGILLLVRVTFLGQNDLLMIFAKDTINSSLIFQLGNSLCKKVSSQCLTIILTINPFDNINNVIELTSSFCLELMLDIEPMLFRQVKAQNPPKVALSNQLALHLWLFLQFYKLIAYLFSILEDFDRRIDLLPAFDWRKCLREIRIDLYVRMA